MGFFNKLFGSSKEEKNQTAPQVRGKYKNWKYFKKEIDSINNSIKNFKEDDITYINTNGKLSAFHFVSYTFKYNKLIENFYSLGEPIQIMQPIFKESIENFSQAWSKDYQGYPLLLQMVSLGILLEVPEAEHQKITAFIYKAHDSNIEAIWKPDNLIFFF